MNSVTVQAIIPAAGSSQRMAEVCKTQSKTLLSLTGSQTILEKNLATLIESETCSGAVVCCRKDELEELERLLSPLKTAAFSLKIIVGGRSRQESVFLGLKQLAGQTTDYVLIHDGARPFCSPELFKKVLVECRSSGAAIAALPIHSTLKKISKNVIEKTISRIDIWQAQTPQAFRYELILKAHQRADSEGYQGTDDSELVERLGSQVSVVCGEEKNIKITTPADLELAKLLAGF